MLSFKLSTVFWHCYLGVGKSIQPVKIEWWVVDVVVCLERGVDCLHMVQLMPLPPQNLIASFESRLVSRFSYRQTQVVLEKEAIKWEWY